MSDGATRIESEVRELRRWYARDAERIAWLEDRVAQLLAGAGEPVTRLPMRPVCDPGSGAATPPDADLDLNPFDLAAIRACPCNYVTPCHAGCACVNPLSSSGCRRCCAYGSVEQRKAMAEMLTAERDEMRIIVDASITLRRAESTDVPGESIAELEAAIPAAQRRTALELLRWREVVDAYRSKAGK